MSKDFPDPKPESIIYEDDLLYVCLASNHIVKGHTIVAWKKDVPDLKYLSERDYDYLMDTVNAVRDAMLKALDIEKVYLVYMDEAKHVHWHLVPRYNEQGFNVFLHSPAETKDFSLVLEIKKFLKFK